GLPPLCGHSRRRPQRRALRDRADAHIRPRPHPAAGQRVRADVHPAQRGVPQALERQPLQLPDADRLSRLHLAYVLPFEWTDATWGLTEGTYARALKAIPGR